jgi:hypothetical protein
MSLEHYIDQLRQSGATRFPEGTSIAQIWGALATSGDLDPQTVKLSRGGHCQVERPLPEPIQMGPMAFVPFAWRGSEITVRVNVLGVEGSGSGEQRLTMPAERYEEIRAAQVVTPERKGPGACAHGYCRKQPVCEGSFCAAVC